MKNYKKAAINIAFLTILLTAGVSAGYAKADTDDNNDEFRRPGQKELLTTFETGDYQTWKKLINKKSRVAAVVEETDFKEFVTARMAARSGDYDQAIELTDKLEEKLKNKIGLTYF